MGVSTCCRSDPSLNSLPRSLTPRPRNFLFVVSASLSGCLVRSLRGRPADGFIRCPGGGGRGRGRPGRARGRPGTEGAGVPGPINLHQAAAGGPLGANGKMEGPVGRAGRASFVLLPAPLAAAPAPPRPSPAAAAAAPPPPRAPFPLPTFGRDGWGEGVQKIWGEGGVEEGGSCTAGEELGKEEGASEAKGRGLRPQRQSLESGRHG